ncbi:hypothetical protein G3M54_35290 [Bacillus megaterium NBRC 15308 = ATCC 14581]|nr:hypothetical protein [Priestia megaterium NBRC 15308 = ATCC 14581]
MSRHTFEDKLKAIDLYLDKRSSYRETTKLMSATRLNDRVLALDRKVNVKK